MFFWVELAICAIANLSAVWCVFLCWRAARRWDAINRVLNDVALGTWRMRRDGWPVRDIWKAEFEDQLPGRSDRRQ